MTMTSTNVTTATTTTKYDSCLQLNASSSISSVSSSAAILASAHQNNQDKSTITTISTITTTTPSSDIFKIIATIAIAAVTSITIFTSNQITSISVLILLISSIYLCCYSSLWPISMSLRSADKMYLETRSPSSVSSPSFINHRKQSSSSSSSSFPINYYSSRCFIRLSTVSSQFFSSLQSTMLVSIVVGLLFNKSNNNKSLNIRKWSLSSAKTTSTSSTTYTSNYHRFYLSSMLLVALLMTANLNIQEISAMSVKVDPSSSSFSSDSSPTNVPTIIQRHSKSNHLESQSSPSFGIKDNLIGVSNLKIKATSFDQCKVSLEKMLVLLCQSTAKSLFAKQRKQQQKQQVFSTTQEDAHHPFNLNSNEDTDTDNVDVDDSRLKRREAKKFVNEQLDCCTRPCTLKELINFC